MAALIIINSHQLDHFLASSTIHFSLENSGLYWTAHLNFWIWKKICYSHLRSYDTWTSHLACFCRKGNFYYRGKYYLVFLDIHSHLLQFFHHHLEEKSSLAATLTVLIINSAYTSRKIYFLLMGLVLVKYGFWKFSEPLSINGLSVFDLNSLTNFV